MRSRRLLKKNRDENSDSGKLFYSVFLADHGCSLGPIGLNNQVVESVHYKDVGALVSDHPRVDSIKLLRKNLAPYHQVNRKASEFFTVVPARFGQIARDAGEVSIALRKNYPMIRRELERLDSKVEMGLKVTWVVADVLNYFIQIDEPLKTRKEQLSKGGKRPTQKDLIDFGTYFHDRMNQFRSQTTEKILAALPPAEARVEEIHDDRMISNVALLIRKDYRDQLEGAVDQLGESMGEEYSLKLEGPWPPFSFVDRLELQLGR